MDPVKAAEMDQVLKARLAKQKEKEAASSAAANPGLFQPAPPPKRRW